MSGFSLRAWGFGSKAASLRTVRVFVYLPRVGHWAGGPASMHGLFDALHDISLGQKLELSQVGSERFENGLLSPA